MKERIAAFYREHRLVRCLCRLLITILILLGVVFLFVRLYPAFGGRPSAQDKKSYAARASNYVNGVFVYPEEYEAAGWAEDKRVSTNGTTPEQTLPAVEPTFSENPEIDTFTVTWFGHSTLLIQMHGLNILFDPVFYDVTSPVPFIGPRRFAELPAEISDLPSIDVVILSHDHYDHLDMNAVKELDGKTTTFIVPLGVENHLERWGIASEKIRTMAWWEETEVSGLMIACTPANHFSNRSFDDRGKTLYASWVLKDAYRQIYESADSGYGGHFEAIHEKYGDFDFALMECGQYNINWHNIHMYPEESVDASLLLGAKVVMPIHWGAFSLSTHAWDDSPERFTTYGEEQGLTVVTPQIGETMYPDSPGDYQARWWRAYQ